MSERPGLIASAIEIGKSAVATMPPAFLLIVILNFAFLWVVLNTIDHQNDQRLSILNTVIDKCLNK